MATFFIAFSIILVLHSNILNAQRCGQNEVWTFCGSHCQRRCDSDWDPNPMMCPAVCMQVCVCERGYIRRSKYDSTCVPEKMCPSGPVPGERCADNAVWSKCASMCPRDCASARDPNPVVCPTVCVEGCTCLRGFIRKSKNDPNCIPEKDCANFQPGRCGPREVWSSCSRACPRNCEDLKNRDPKVAIACPAVCRKGCVCRPGFIRTSRTNPFCMLERDCPHLKPREE